MKKKKDTLRVYFTLIVFAIMFVSAILMASLAAILFRLGLFQIDGGNPSMPILTFLFFSVVIGTAFSSFVARKILRPITKFSKAAAEVATGNFAVRLSETGGVTETREMARNFNLMVQELSSIETLRNDFVANVSHEFKTPIAAVEGYAALLQSEDLSKAERDDYTKMIMDSAHQLATLSDNILRLSRLENQDMIPDKANFRLDEQIRQTVLFLEPKWTAKELDMQIELSKVTYNGNEQLLWQVWMNLIGNAIKFTNDGGLVSIRLTGGESGVVFRISDTGCGMDDKVRRHIFEKFYQGDTARKSEGNGLGLALVRRIVDMCGGEISVESKTDEGTVFTVRLT